MNHSFVTIAIPFKRERSDAVAAYLDTLGNPAQREVRARLDDAEFVHFMSINAVPDNRGGRAHLIIEASVDGGAEAGLERLSALLASELRSIFAAAEIDIGEERLSRSLARHRVTVGHGWFSNPGLDFDGTPRLSVVRVRREFKLAHRIGKMIDQLPREPSALNLLHRVRAELWNDGKMKWAFVDESAPFLEPAPAEQAITPGRITGAIAKFFWPHLLVAALAGAIVWYFVGTPWAVVAGALAFACALVARGAPSPRNTAASVVWSAVANFLWPVLLIVLFAFGATWALVGFGWALAAGAATLLVIALLLVWAYRRFRRGEETDASEDEPPSAALVQALMEREGVYTHGLLAAASTIKPGIIRAVTLRLGLSAAGLASQYFSRPGFLSQIGVIHFARWFRLPGTNKLMFFSNYDGAWESYLEDFIERGARGVTAIWSNTVGFPRTKNLLDGGARDGDRLRRWTRQQMFPARFWYSAYPHLTLNRIRINARIRRGLATAATEAEAADWLACFGSEPRPPEPIETSEVPIETSEVPILVFGGVRPLRHGACLLVRFADGDRAKAWLAKIGGQVSFGDQVPDDAALVVGFAASGLIKLGLTESQIATFPIPFQQGNDAPWRARALGDIGEDSPERWWWGGPDKKRDAVIVLYGRDRPSFERLYVAQVGELEHFRHDWLEIRFAEVPENGFLTEPFGFVDGVSQPLIRGTRRAATRPGHHQVVAPGEFILGYPDNFGYIPPTPTVGAAEDPLSRLPPLRSADGESARLATVGERDLGRNGTFLVVRQLEQDLAGFKDFLTQAAHSLIHRGYAPANELDAVQDWIGARMVGRWKDGSPLVSHPDRPGGRSHASENDFLFGKEDPGGLRCPLGAHIRRANPRDSFEPGSHEQLAITNRHRILRVGRPYEPQNGWQNPGLVFMCLNVDIERQFEFVQQTWLMARSFHGLENETDAMLNNVSESKLFTIPTPQGPLRIPGLTRFVTVRGGGYFFLPSQRAMSYLALR